eukprot:2463194-Amphidinium_carterae.1
MLDASSQHNALSAMFRKIYTSEDLGLCIRTPDSNTVLQYFATVTELRAERSQQNLVRVNQSAKKGSTDAYIRSRHRLGHLQ